MAHILRAEFKLQKL